MPQGKIQPPPIGDCEFTISRKHLYTRPVKPGHFRLSGLGVVGAVPTTFVKSQYSEYLAFTQRFALAPTEPRETTDAQWERIIQLLDDPEFRAPVDVTSDLFHDWNIRYPPGLASTHSEFHIPGVDTRPLDPLHLYASSFLKHELAVYPDNPLPRKPPRVIISFRPVINVRHGPMAYALQKAIRSRDHMTWLYYAPGMTASEIGAVFDKFEGYYCTEGDFSTFDGRAVPGQVRFSARYASKNGCSKEYIQSLDEDYKYVRLRFGMGSKARTKGATQHKTPSGRHETTLFNSISNAAMLAAGLLAQGFDLRRCGILVGGDDSLIFTPTPIDLDQLVAFVAKAGHKLEGFTGPIDATRHTFYSSCFVPINGRSYLTLKPGRFIAKSGWQAQPHSCQPLPWLRGIALGGIQDMNHMPVVRAILRRYLAATTTLQSSSRSYPRT